MNVSKSVSSHLIDDRDRKLTTSELQQFPPSSSPGKSPVQAKSPRVKFFRQDGADTHSTSPRQPPSNRLGPVPMFVTVQEPTTMKDWTVNSVKGDRYDRFKSPALFWEVRLKESQINNEKAYRPTAPQAVALCEILSEYAEKAAAQGDQLFSTVKDQVFSAIFADYSLKDAASYANKEDLLRSCVPYFIIAERLHGDKMILEKKLEHLEKLALQPLARSLQSSAVQTDEGELDVNSGAIALQRKILGLMYQVEEYETDNFNNTLERQEIDTKTKRLIESQKEQIMRLTEFSTRMRKQCEIEKESSELYRHQVLKLEAENIKLTEEAKAMAKEQISLRFSYDKKLAFVSDTLKTERQRFTKERADWLESFVSERYDLFNSILFDAHGDEKSQEDDTDGENSDAKTHGSVDMSRRNSVQDPAVDDEIPHHPLPQEEGRRRRLSIADSVQGDHTEKEAHPPGVVQTQRRSSIVPGDMQRLRRPSIAASEAHGPDDNSLQPLGVPGNKRVSIAQPAEFAEIAAAAKAHSIKSSAQLEAERLKHELWSRITELGKISAAKLETLYTDEGKLESDKEHTQWIRDVLKEQEFSMQQLLLTTSALQEWDFSC